MPTSKHCWNKKWRTVGSNQQPFVQCYIYLNCYTSLHNHLVIISSMYHVIFINNTAVDEIERIICSHLLARAHTYFSYKILSLNLFYFNQYEKRSGKKFYQHYIKPSPRFPKIIMHDAVTCKMVANYSAIQY